MPRTPGRYRTRARTRRSSRRRFPWSRTFRSSSSSPARIAPRIRTGCRLRFHSQAPGSRSRTRRSCSVIARRPRRRPRHRRPPRRRNTPRGAATHAPSEHAWSLAHALEQVPQWSCAVARSTQLELHCESGGVQAATHPDGAQRSPLGQAPPSTQADARVTFASHPFDGSPSKSAQPAWHRAIAHAPCAHSGSAFGNRHGWQLPAPQPTFGSSGETPARRTVTQCFSLRPRSTYLMRYFVGNYKPVPSVGIRPSPSLTPTGRLHALSHQSSIVDSCRGPWLECSEPCACGSEAKVRYGGADILPFPSLFKPSLRV
jgi:hypothetical protein